MYMYVYAYIHVYTCIICIICLLASSVRMLVRRCSCAYADNVIVCTCLGTLGHACPCIRRHASAYVWIESCAYTYM